MTRTEQMQGPELACLLAAAAAADWTLSGWQGAVSKAA